MSEYKHGAYGVLGESVARASSVAETVPVYIGTAPVNLVRGWDQTGAVGVPVKVTGALDAQAKIGHAQDWAAYTLCEAVAAHYDAGEDGIGPIYVINVLDPSTHCAKADTEATLTFAAGKAVIDSTSIILDTLRVGAGEGTAYAEGEDYTVSYNFAAGRATIASADPDRPIQGDVPCTWREVDPSKVTASEVAEAVSAVALLYQEQFAVPNILAAPGWSDSPEVYRALVAGAAKVNGHWDAYVMADLPLSDAKKKPVDTISGAIAWKDENGYSSERSSVFCRTRRTRRAACSTSPRSPWPRRCARTPPTTACPSRGGATAPSPSCASASPRAPRAAGSTRWPRTSSTSGASPRSSAGEASGCCGGRTPRRSATADPTTPVRHSRRACECSTT